MAQKKTSVLFVCLGNICRSTMAEGIFRHLAQKPEWEGKIGRIDSCGTAAYHTGDSPDERTMATLEENGITGYEHHARRLATSDFDQFDYIFAMDRSNLSDLHRLQRSKHNSSSSSSSSSGATVCLFGEYSGTGKAEVVDDPYYGGDGGFKRTFEQCSRFGENFLREVVGGEGETRTRVT